MNLSYLQTNDPAVVKEIGRLRSRVWRGEKGDEFRESADPECWLDSYDDDAMHWAILNEKGEIIAAARLSFHTTIADAPNALAYCDRDFTEGPIVASFNRLVVDPEYRGQGIARSLDELRMIYAKERGADLVLALPVGYRRTEALMKLGFLSFGSIKPSHRYQIYTKNIDLWVLATPLNDAASRYLSRRLPGQPAKLPLVVSGGIS